MTMSQALNNDEEDVEIDDESQENDANQMISPSSFSKLAHAKRTV